MHEFLLKSIQQTQGRDVTERLDGPTPSAIIPSRFGV